MSDNIRAYVFHFTGKDGSRCSVSIDFVYTARVSREQATSNALGSVIQEKGPDWIASWECTEVEW